MAVLDEAHRQHPTDWDVLMALVSIARDTGEFATALRHARELAALDPAATRLRALVSDLEKRQGHKQGRYLPFLCGLGCQHEVRNWHRRDHQLSRRIVGLLG